MTTGGKGASSSSCPELPDVLLHVIIRRITKLKDVMSFRAVCKSWREAVAAAAQDISHHHPPGGGKFRQPFPWIIWPCKDSSSHGPSCRQFIDVAAGNNNNSIVSRHIIIVGDNPSVDLFLSSSTSGRWLLRVKRPSSQKRYFPYLLNPFTGSQIRLPSFFPADPERPWVIKAFAMSAAEPAEEGCTVMVCYRHKDNPCVLAFCKIGVDHQWTVIDIPLPPPPTEEGEDQQIWDINGIVFWRGRFHAVCGASREILVCDHLSRQPMVSSVASHPPRQEWPLEPPLPRFHKNWPKTYYLLESPAGEGWYDLMLVVRSFNLRPEVPGVYYFEVFKIDVCGNKFKYVGNIGDYALLLDRCNAVLVSVEDRPECKRNCIYHESGIFNLDTLQDEVEAEDPRECKWNSSYYVRFGTFIDNTPRYKKKERPAFDFPSLDSSTAWILPSIY